MFVRIATVLLIVFAFWGAMAHGSGASGHSHIYVVRAGDTAWSIVAGHYGGDTRRGVWDLEQINHLSGEGAISAGERLRLPW